MHFQIYFVAVAALFLAVAIQAITLFKCLWLSELPLQNAAGTLSLLAFVGLALLVWSSRKMPTDPVVVKGSAADERCIEKYHLPVHH